MCKEKNRVLGGVKKVYSFFSVIGWLATVILSVTVLWSHYGPEKILPDEKRQEIGVKVVDQITSQIQEQRGTAKRAILLHFANDPTDFVTDRLREKISSSGILDLNDLGFWEKIRKQLNLRIEGCDSLVSALKTVEGEEVDAVIWGKIDQYESFKNSVIMKGSWQLVDIKTGNIICEGKIDEDTTRELPAKVADKIDEITEKISPIAQVTQTVAWYNRFLIFLLVILLLPIMTISFLRTMVSKRSNGINATILSIYTVIGMILAFFMVGACFASALSVILFIVASLLAFIYNYFMMSFALKLES
jgi:hypothetical protein